MLDLPLEAKQGLLQRDLLVEEQIVPNPLELIMWHLLDCQYQVPWYHIRDLLSLSFEDIFVTVRSSLLHFNHDRLSLVDHSLSPALRAVFRVDNAPCSTPIALNLHLHVHAQSHLQLLHNNSLAIALRTLLGLSVLRSAASTLSTIHIPGYLDLFGGS